MNTLDPEKERNEALLSTKDFLLFYNSNLPDSFPHASLSLLEEFKKTYPNLFKKEEMWTLDQHRKKVMDWLTQQVNPI